ncbi:MAG: hypothetical protein LC777_11205 [Actinobacteria bacterium]|nr:hypothetical protein [Actinomycetota bacterium]
MSSSGHIARGCPTAPEAVVSSSGALPEDSSPRPDGADTFDRLARAASTGRMAFALGIASLGERFDRVATLHVDEPLARDLRRVAL